MTLPGMKPDPPYQPPDYEAVAPSAEWEVSDPSTEMANAINNGYAGYSCRQFFPNLPGEGREFRFTFLNTMPLRFCSFEMYDNGGDIKDTLYAPREILFSGGHGISGADSFPNVIVSDWIMRPYDWVSGVSDMVVVMDVGTGGTFYWGAFTGPIMNYKEDETSYNIAVPYEPRRTYHPWTGHVNYCGLITKIEVR